MFISLPFPSFPLQHASPALLPGYLSITSSQICGKIIKYVQEDVMPLEKCLHALIFSTKAAALPLPQRRQLRSSTEICTYIHTPPTLSKKTICKPFRGSAKHEHGLHSSENPGGSAVRLPHWKLKNDNKNNNTKRSRVIFFSGLWPEMCITTWARYQMH